MSSTEPDAGPTRRELYERAQRRRANMIATISTVVAVGLVVVLVPRASGWPKVKRSFFNWPILRDTFGDLIDAFWLDVRIFVLAAPAILVVAMLIALARNTRNPALFPLRAFSAAYVDIFRGVPVVLTIYLIGFGVPGLGLSRTLGQPIIWGSVALVLAYSAYVSEVFRAGIDSVHESQRAAARSLGMTHAQTMRSVVLPQAVRRVVPPLMNDLISLQKDVALVSLIGPVELLREAGIQKAKFANFTPYVGAALIFLAVTIPLTRTADYLLVRQRRRTGGSAIA